MMFYDFFHRFLLTFGSFCLVCLLLLFVDNPLVQVVTFLLLSALCGFALWEYGIIVDLSRDRMLLFLLPVLGVAVLGGFFLFSLFPSLFFVPIGILLVSVVLFFCFRFSCIEGAVSAITRAFFGLVYIAVPLGLLLSILYLGGGESGAMYVGYLLAVTKGADIGAYLGGRMFGRIKLAPQLSPKKTAEGAIIGLLTAILVSFFFSFIFYSPLCFAMAPMQSLFYGALLGGLGQIGDLAESILKREKGIKDSNAIAGIGGALDALDSLLFTTPFFYFILASGLL